MNRIIKYFVRFFAFMGFMSFLSTMALIAFVVYLSKKAPEFPEKAILSLDFAETITPYMSSNPLRRFISRDTISIMDYTDAIRKAAEDERVQGLYANISFASVDLAMLEEIRAAVQYFKAQGKWTVVFADTLGEGGNAMGAYYLASAFDEVYMQPTGSLSLMGIGVEMPFLKETLAKIGVQPDFGQRHEFKTGANNLTEDGFTEAHRQSTLDLVQTLYDTLAQGVAVARPEADSLDDILAQSPLPSALAEQTGLIDGVAYEVDVLEKLAKRVWGEEATLSDTEGWLRIADYRRFRQKPSFTVAQKAGERPKLALVQIVGAILRKVDDKGLSASDDMADAQAIAASIIDAANNDAIKAILLRVDSGGGSYVASDTIRHAILYAKKRKPVVASMGSYAASGGYFVAMDADKVYANAMTLTGSIGVFGGKMVASELLDTIGVRMERLGIGARAFMWSPTTAFNDDERAAFDGMLDAVYDDFTTKVVQARGVDNVDALARGRVWTGGQAARHKLVDTIGTFHDALAHTKTTIGLTPETPVNLVIYPAAKNPFDALLGGLFSAQLMPAWLQSLLVWQHLPLKGTDAAVMPPFFLGAF
jgi:protease-4